jgi:hypothetical protein
MDRLQEASVPAQDFRLMDLHHQGTSALLVIKVFHKALDIILSRHTLKLPSALLDFAITHHNHLPNHSKLIPLPYPLVLLRQA